MTGYVVVEGGVAVALGDTRTAWANWQDWWSEAIDRPDRFCASWTQSRNGSGTDQTGD